MVWNCFAHHLLKTWSWPYLTHWGRDKMDAISQTTVSNAFSWMKMHQFCFRFHWNLFLNGSINNILSLVRIMAWRPGDKPLSDPTMVSLPTHICVTRPQWLNSNYSIARTSNCSVWSHILSALEWALWDPKWPTNVSLVHPRNWSVVFICNAGKGNRVGISVVILI